MVCFHYYSFVLFTGAFSAFMAKTAAFPKSFSKASQQFFFIERGAVEQAAGNGLKVNFCFLNFKRNEESFQLTVINHEARRWKRSKIFSGNLECRWSGVSLCNSSEFDERWFWVGLTKYLSWTLWWTWYHILVIFILFEWWMWWKMINAMALMTLFTLFR